MSYYYDDDDDEYDDEDDDEYDENDDGDDFDDGRSEYDDDGYEYEDGYEGVYDPDSGDGPEWWQEDMPEEWWDMYDDSYEYEEFEIAIDY